MAQNRARRVGPRIAALSFLFYGFLFNAFLLSGCALKDPPPAEQILSEGVPNVVMPEAWQSRDGQGSAQQDWLATFESEALNALVQEALDNNTDLMMAAARVDQAAAALEAAGANLLPRSDLMGRAGGKNSGDNSGLAGALLNVSWEVDLWGRFRYARRAAEEQYLATEADYVSARQSIAATVARAWFVAIEARLQAEIAHAMVADAQDVVGLAESRVSVGQGNEIDVATARVNLYALQDSALSFELAHRDALRALEVMLGRYPAAADGADLELPLLAQTPPAGVPSELLDRRPDVIAARHRIAAAFSRVEEARTLRLPAFSLTGSLSHISSDLFVLERRDDIVASGGAKLYLPIFNGGEITAQIEARTAEQNLAVAAWGETALRAFQEVEAALANEVTLSAREPLLAAQVDESVRATALERDRYRTGTIDLRPVLQQQLSTYGARTRLLRVQAERRVQRVNLFLALGGGFRQEIVVTAER